MSRTSFQIIPFTDEMLPEAGELLALRQGRLRATCPELPAAFAEPAAARAAVEAVWRREWADGVAALRGGRMVGYLIGDMVLDTLWGRSGWVRFAGCALAEEQDPEVVRDLYAALGARWVSWGCFAHSALMPAADAALVAMWFALAFGIEHVYALADLANLDLSPRPVPSGVEIRPAGPQDRPFLEELSDVIWRHLVKAPCWGIHLPERQERHRREWGDLAADPEGRIWLAFTEGEATGIQGYFPAQASVDDPLTPGECTELCVAGTREWARGRGIGQALTRLGMAHERSAGYRFCLTDWRSTNLEASRFWPRQGFRSTVLRLARRVDSRIAWGGARP
jgi:hypothetical protein